MRIGLRVAETCTDVNIDTILLQTSGCWGRVWKESRESCEGRIAERSNGSFATPREVYSELRATD